MDKFGQSRGELEMLFWTQMTKKLVMQPIFRLKGYRTNHEATHGPRLFYNYTYLTYSIQ